MDILWELIIPLMSKYIDFKDCCSLSIAIPDDSLWKLVAYELYWSKDFWDRAGRRSIKTSKPLQSWRQEVLRIHEFQEHARWNEEDYYEWWDVLELKD